jgi:tRNA pseudouridine38-40 synthase
MNYRTYYRHPLNIEAMKEALALVQGEHDFKSFTKNHRLENTTRELYEASLMVEGPLLRLRFHGNGFMHNMVRIIVAMVMEVGKGKLQPTDLLAILEAKNRRLAPKTAPANGLYLIEVCY